MKQILILTAILTCSTLSATVRIAQIDQNPLLFNQKVHAYISVTKQGRPVSGLNKDNFDLYESSSLSNSKFKQVKITGFSFWHKLQEWNNHSASD